MPAMFGVRCLLPRQCSYALLLKVGTPVMPFCCHVVHAVGPSAWLPLLLNSSLW